MSRISAHSPQPSARFAFLKSVFAFLFFANFCAVASAQLACKYNLDEVIYPSPRASCEGFQSRVLTPTVYGFTDTTSTIVGLDLYVRTIFTGFGLPNTYYLDASCNLRTSNPDNGMNLWITCHCTEGFKMNQQGVCESPNQPILTPLPQTPLDPRPANTGGTSTLFLKAMVTENGSPKKDVVVTFGVEVIANSGGHDHHDASRPKGKVTPTNGVTDANGEFKITFKAEEFAGTHVVAAVCESCSNKSATRNVDVKVPDLIELQGDFSRGAKYELIGDTPEHKGNHFFTPAAKEALKNLLPVFAEFNWGVVGVNDSSLKWGGRFDIAGHWGGGHKEHRDGKEVDLSFYKPFGTITEDKRKKVYDDLYKSRGVGLPQVLWHKEDNPDPKNPSKAHFHVYLLGQSFFRETKY